jgi:hypothetical protein
MEEEAPPVKINGRAVWKMKELEMCACAHTHTHTHTHIQIMMLCNSNCIGPLPSDSGERGGGGHQQDDVVSPLIKSSDTSRQQGDLLIFLTETGGRHRQMNRHGWIHRQTSRCCHKPLFIFSK